MNVEGPSLAALVQRLVETPEIVTRPGSVDLIAAWSDLRRSLGGDWFTEAEGREIAELIRTRTTTNVSKENWSGVVTIVAWLLDDPAFHGMSPVAERVTAVLSSQRWSELSEIVRAADFVSDPQRREELARSLLSELNLRPAGESGAQAEDRFRAVDSVFAHRVANESSERRARQQKVIDAMRKKQAEESAANYSRE